MTDDELLATAHAVITRTHADLNALLDPLDYPGLWTQRERDAYDHRREVLRARLQGFTRDTRDLSAAMAPLADATAWRDILLRMRQTLRDELVACADDDPKQFNLRWSLRELEVGAAEGTGYELENSRLGALLRAEGFTAPPPTEGRRFGKLPWFGSLAEVDERLDLWQRRHDEARQSLEIALREYEPEREPVVTD
jgi:hypothetical protein